jgi:hypothetical protein
MSASALPDSTNAETSVRTLTAAEKEGKLPNRSPYTYCETKTVMERDKPLDNDAIYSVTTDYFLAVGGDGFEIFSKYAQHYSSVPLPITMSLPSSLR